ncbi:MAG TPA: hypothetical protein VLA24_16160 [Pseudomonadales bacterium]|nr:hypothetical protein [Pseudomonadales bacterium]
MPWFVCFDVAPATGHGVWQRIGLSSIADSAEDAVAEVRAAMAVKHGPLGEPADVFQYQENDY